ncbi:MAG: hypothetical protein KY468_14960 [Armatimonadetes bacterium]|nr:hypothetical protein [Armatimonadota bacterium]
MAEYRNASDEETPAFDNGDAWDYWFWGWLMALYDLLRGIREIVTLNYRKVKVRRLCRRILPRYPESLICPQCLHVLKRGSSEPQPLRRESGNL